MNDLKQEITVVLEYLKSLREEIHLRVQKHTRLVWIKVLSLGGITWFLVVDCYGVTKSDSTSEILLSYIAWMVPVIAIVFDMLIASNLRVINNLGSYIKVYFEIEAFSVIKKAIQDSLDKEYLFRIKIPKGQTLKEVLTIGKLKANFESRGFLLSQNAHVCKCGDQWRIDDEEREFFAEEKNEYVNIKYPKFGFWEEKVAQAAPEHHCYIRKDMYTIWVFTFISVFFPFLMLWRSVPSTGIDRAFGFHILVHFVFLILWIYYSHRMLQSLLRSITLARRF